MPREDRAPRAHGTFLRKDGQVELMDLDWVILGMLPEEGAMQGKYLKALKTSSDVKKELQDPNVSGNVVAGRLRQLRAAGFAEPYRTVGRKDGGKGWQRTKEGEQALAERGGQG